MRQNYLVKLSGDMIPLQADLVHWLREKAANNYLVILVGGGTQINEAFKEAGFPVRKHGPLGRELETLGKRQLARDVLEMNQAAIQDGLSAAGIQCAVEIPVIQVGTVLCHVNGDQYLLSAYNGFDQLYVITTIDRHDAKVEQFKKYEHIHVLSFKPSEVPA